MTVQIPACDMQGSSSLEESDLVAGMEDLMLTSKGGRPLTLTPEQVHPKPRNLKTGCKMPHALGSGTLGLP